MKILICLLALSLSFSAMACMNLKAVLKVNDEQLFVHQKVDFNETYSFMKGPYIFSIKIAPGVKKESYLINIDVETREGTMMKEVSQAKMTTLDDQEAEMSSKAKGSDDVLSYKMTITKI